MNQRRTLVLMPGLEGNGKLFAPIIPLLQSHFELSIVTYPDLDSFTDYIGCARNQLPDAPGFSVVAESFSGPVAMALMAQEPERFGRSVLAATFARSPLATLTRMANYVPRQMFSIGALNEFCLDVCAADNEDSSETQPLPLNVMEQLDGAVLKHKIAVLSRIDVSALLPSIAVPILLLRAVRDRIVSEADAQMIEQYLPDVERIDIDAPHLLLQTSPQQCAELIVKHLQTGA
ncbi:MAG: alpha/beta hydrolase [Gammaproteobacteria bacterium]|nr:alpha/beta hydrolase [Gammaproteobacteria bacterium]